MTFITARELRLQPAELWSRLKTEGDIVITLNGKPCAIITGITPETLENSLLLLKQLRVQMAVARMREASLKSGTDKLSQVDINKEIRAVRRKRRGR